WRDLPGDVFAREFPFVWIDLRGLIRRLHRRGGRVTRGVAQSADLTLGPRSRTIGGLLPLLRRFGARAVGRLRLHDRLLVFPCSHAATPRNRFPVDAFLAGTCGISARA